MLTICARCHTHRRYLLCCWRRVGGVLEQKRHSIYPRRKTLIEISPRCSWSCWLQKQSAAEKTCQHWRLRKATPQHKIKSFYRGEAWGNRLGRDHPAEQKETSECHCLKQYRHTLFYEHWKLYRLCEPIQVQQSSPWRRASEAFPLFAQSKPN